MLRGGTKRLLLNVAAFLFATLPLLVPAAAKAADSGVINVTLSPNTPGTTLVAKRIGDYLGKNTFYFHQQGGVWTTGVIPGTDGGFNSDCLGDVGSFTVTATDASGTVQGTQTVNCVIAPTNITITLPKAGKTGTLSGTISVTDPNANPPTGGHKPLQGTTVTLKQENGGNSYTYTLPQDPASAPGTANGKYQIAGIVPGTYTVTVTGQYNSAVSQTNLNFTYTKSGVKIKAGSNTLDINATGDKNDGGDKKADCDAGIAGFTWIVCGLIHQLVDVIDWIRDSVVVPFLSERPLDKNDKNVAPVYAVWTAFRNVAAVFFILMFFLVIFGTALGWDNYTIKKILPRLVAGAVLVPLSWYVCVVVIDVGNILGQGLVALTSSVIHDDPNFNFKTVWSKVIFSGALVGVGGAAVGAASAGATAITTVTMGVVVSAFVGFMTTFIVLVLRKILIMLLVVLSPFALLAWILPNTEKWFKEWWSNFFKLVMMYPLIMLLFEAGRLFASVAPGIFGGGN